jgi:hypothetical protein
LPDPFGPVIASASPADNEKSTPEKTIRPPRRHSSPVAVRLLTRFRPGRSGGAKAFSSPTFPTDFVMLLVCMAERRKRLYKPQHCSAAPIARKGEKYRFFN